jgi:hypothetical protein
VTTDERVRRSFVEAHIQMFAAMSGYYYYCYIIIVVVAIAYERVRRSIVEA